MTFPRPIQRALHPFGAFCLLGLLVAPTACSDLKIDKPKAPDMSALTAVYEAPNGTFDEAVVKAFEADLIARVPLALKLGLDVEVGGTADGAVEASDDPEGQTQATWPEAQTQATDEGSLIQGSGFIVVTRICDGWESPPKADKANGTMVLNLGFTDDGLDPVIWGTVTDCKYVFDGSQVSLGGVGSDNDGEVRLRVEGKQIKENPMLFDVDLEAVIDGAPSHVDFDFRILPDGSIEMRSPVPDGSIIGSVKDSTLIEVRAQNGVFVCDIPAGKCTNEAGDEVPL